MKTRIYSRQIIHGEMATRKIEKCMYFLSILPVKKNLALEKISLSCRSVRQNVHVSKLVHILIKTSFPNQSFTWMEANSFCTLAIYGFENNDVLKNIL